MQNTGSSLSGGLSGGVNSGGIEDQYELLEPANVNVENERIEANIPTSTHSSETAMVSDYEYSYSASSYYDTKVTHSSDMPLSTSHIPDYSASTIYESTSTSVPQLNEERNTEIESSFTFTSSLNQVEIDSLQPSTDTSDTTLHHGGLQTRSSDSNDHSFTAANTTNDSYTSSSSFNTPNTTFTDVDMTSMEQNYNNNGYDSYHHPQTISAQVQEQTSHDQSSGNSTQMQLAQDMFSDSNFVPDSTISTYSQYIPQQEYNYVTDITNEAEPKETIELDLTPMDQQQKQIVQDTYIPYHDSATSQVQTQDQLSETNQYQYSSDPNHEYTVSSWSNETGEGCSDTFQSHTSLQDPSQSLFINQNDADAMVYQNHTDTNSSMEMQQNPQQQYAVDYAVYPMNDYSDSSVQMTGTNGIIYTSENAGTNYHYQQESSAVCSGADPSRAQEQEEGIYQYQPLPQPMSYTSTSMDGSNGVITQPEMSMADQPQLSSIPIQPRIPLDSPEIAPDGLVMTQTVLYSDTLDVSNKPSYTDMNQYQTMDQSSMVPLLAQDINPVIVEHASLPTIALPLATTSTVMVSDHVYEESNQKDSKCQVDSRSPENIAQVPIPQEGTVTLLSLARRIASAPIPVNDGKRRGIISGSIFFGTEANTPSKSSVFQSSFVEAANRSGSGSDSVVMKPFDISQALISNPSSPLLNPTEVYTSMPSLRVGDKDQSGEEDISSEDDREDESFSVTFSVSRYDFTGMRSNQIFARKRNDSADEQEQEHEYDSAYESKDSEKDSKSPVNIHHHQQKIAKGVSDSSSPKNLSQSRLGSSLLSTTATSDIFPKTVLSLTRRSIKSENNSLKIQNAAASSDLSDGSLSSGLPVKTRRSSSLRNKSLVSTRSMRSVRVFPSRVSDSSKSSRYRSSFDLTDSDSDVDDVIKASAGKTPKGKSKTAKKYHSSSSTASESEKSSAQLDLGAEKKILCQSQDESKANTESVSKQATRLSGCADVKPLRTSLMDEHGKDGKNVSDLFVPILPEQLTSQYKSLQAISAKAGLDPLNYSGLFEGSDGGEIPLHKSSSTTSLNDSIGSIESIESIDSVSSVTSITSLSIPDSESQTSLSHFSMPVPLLNTSNTSNTSVTSDLKTAPFTSNFKFSKFSTLKREGIKRGIDLVLADSTDQRSSGFLKRVKFSHTTMAQKKVRENENAKDDDENRREADVDEDLLSDHPGSDSDIFTHDGMTSGNSTDAENLTQHLNKTSLPSSKLNTKTARRFKIRSTGQVTRSSLRIPLPGRRSRYSSTPRGLPHSIPSGDLSFSLLFSHARSRSQSPVSSTYPLHSPEQNNALGMGIGTKSSIGIPNRGMATPTNFLISNAYCYSPNILPFPRHGMSRSASRSIPGLATPVSLDGSILYELSDVEIEPHRMQSSRVLTAQSNFSELRSVSSSMSSSASPSSSSGLGTTETSLGDGTSSGTNETQVPFLTVFGSGSLPMNYSAVVGSGDINNLRSPLISPVTASSMGEDDEPKTSSGPVVEVDGQLPSLRRRSLRVNSEPLEEQSKQIQSETAINTVVNSLPGSLLSKLPLRASEDSGMEVYDIGSPLLLGIISGSVNKNSFSLLSGSVGNKGRAATEINSFLTSPKVGGLPLSTFGKQSPPLFNLSGIDALSPILNGAMGSMTKHPLQFLSLKPLEDYGSHGLPLKSSVRVLERSSASDPLSSVSCEGNPGSDDARGDDSSTSVSSGISRSIMSTDPATGLLLLSHSDSREMREATTTSLPDTLDAPAIMSSLDMQSALNSINLIPSLFTRKVESSLPSTRLQEDSSGPVIASLSALTAHPLPFLKETKKSKCLQCLQPFQTSNLFWTFRYQILNQLYHLKPHQYSLDTDKHTAPCKVRFLCDNKEFFEFGTQGPLNPMHLNPVCLDCIHKVHKNKHIQMKLLPPHPNMVEIPPILSSSSYSWIPMTDLEVQGVDSSSPVLTLKHNILNLAGHITAAHLETDLRGGYNMLAPLVDTDSEVLAAEKYEAEKEAAKKKSSVVPAVCPPGMSREQFEFLHHEQNLLNAYGFDSKEAVFEGLSPATIAAIAIVFNGPGFSLDNIPVVEPDVEKMTRDSQRQLGSQSVSSSLSREFSTNVDEKALSNVSTSTSKSTSASVFTRKNSSTILSSTNSSLNAMNSLTIIGPEAGGTVNSSTNLSNAGYGLPDTPVTLTSIHNNFDSIINTSFTGSCYYYIMYADGNYSPPLIDPTQMGYTFYRKDTYLNGTLAMMVFYTDANHPITSSVSDPPSVSQLFPEPTMCITSYLSSPAISSVPSSLSTPLTTTNSMSSLSSKWMSDSTTSSFSTSTNSSTNTNVNANMSAPKYYRNSTYTTSSGQTSTTTRGTGSRRVSKKEARAAAAAAKVASSSISNVSTSNYSTLTYPSYSTTGQQGMSLTLPGLSTGSNLQTGIGRTDLTPSANMAYSYYTNSYGEEYDPTSTDASNMTSGSVGTSMSHLSATSSTIPSTSSGSLLSSSSYMKYSYPSYYSTAVSSSSGSNDTTSVGIIVSENTHTDYAGSDPVTPYSSTNASNNTYYTNSGIYSSGVVGSDTRTSVGSGNTNSDAAVYDSRYYTYPSVDSSHYTANSTSSSTLMADGQYPANTSASPYAVESMTTYSNPTELTNGGYSYGSVSDTSSTYYASSYIPPTTASTIPGTFSQGNSIDLSQDSRDDVSGVTGTGEIHGSVSNGNTDTDYSGYYYSSQTQSSPQVVSQSPQSTGSLTTANSYYSTSAISGSSGISSSTFNSQSLTSPGSSFDTSTSYVQSVVPSSQSSYHGTYSSLSMSGGGYSSVSGNLSTPTDILTAAEKCINDIIDGAVKINDYNHNLATYSDATGSTSAKQ